MRTTEQEANRERIRQQIQQISQDLAELSQRLEDLIIAEEQGNADLQQNEHDLIVGDRVVITNNYRGQRGLTGRITRVTARQVHLRLDGQDRTLIKRKENVRRIEEEE